MGTKYSKPCGAFADVKELEYISALLQTERVELRKDGSIQAIDIASFLMSRYGIQVTEEQVKETILMEFGQCPRQKGGGSDQIKNDKEDNEPAGEEDCYDETSQHTFDKTMEHLDLTQLLAMLLIPSLIKAKAKLDEYHPSTNGTITAKHENSDQKNSIMSCSFLSAVSHLETIEEPKESSPQKHEINNIEDTYGFQSIRWTAKQSEKGDARHPDSDLIESVLEMMLHDATGKFKPQPLTNDLIRQLLLFYGEVDMADDDSLLDEMIRAASIDGVAEDVEGNPIMLDKHSFARALTSDVGLYCIENEESMTTNFYDVFQKPCHLLQKPVLSNGQNSKSMSNDGHNLRQALEEAGEKDVPPVETVFTFPSIDYTADTFRSKSFVILLWVTWILSYFAYMFDDNNSETGVLVFGILDCEARGNNFGCWIAQGIVNWLIIMLQLSVLGTTFVLWASIGNGHSTNPLYVLLSMAAILLFTILPFFFEFELSPNGGVIISTIKRSSINQKMLYYLALLGGFLLLLAEVRILIQNLFPHSLWERSACIKHYLIAGTIQMEAKVKKASSYKLNRLIRNACTIHINSVTGVAGESETTFGRALLCYSKSLDQTESVGGPIWMWRKLIKLEIFEEEGVWLTTHLLAGNMAQFTICVFLVSFFVYIFRADWYKNVLSILPEEQQWRLHMALMYGLAWGEGATLVNAFNYIPSTIRTIIQFRSGGIPSLHDPKFLKYRFAVDQSSLLFGTIFWGTLYTAILIGVCAMIFLGICLWPDFAQVVIQIWASFIGFLLTVLIKWAILMMMRRYYHRAFFRTKPALANFVGVVLESWNLGLTTQHMIFRTLRLLFAASFFIGRVDTPLLTPEATFLGPFEIDGYPLIFRKDLLSHEAHRHPYIERLGVIFMMKLRHGRKFGRYPSTCWRLLFSFALMPWMRKYRLSPDNIEVSDFRFAAMRMWTGRIPKGTPSQALPDTDNNESDGKDSDLKKVNENLRKELTRLQVENDMLRCAIYQPSNHYSAKMSPSSRRSMFKKIPSVIETRANN